jgi:hypothetical protein
MQQQLVGKIALVTEASRGIGRAIAQRLASAGATVVLSLNTSSTLPGTLEETAELIRQAGGRALTIAADLDNPAQRARRSTYPQTTRPSPSNTWRQPRWRCVICPRASAPACSRTACTSRSRRA